MNVVRSLFTATLPILMDITLANGLSESGQFMMEGYGQEVQERTTFIVRTPETEL